MARNVYQLRGLQVPRPAELAETRLQTSDELIRCPHFNLRSLDDRTMAVCNAVPMFAPISKSRKGAYCLSSAHRTCPHFQYLALQSRAIPAPASRTSNLRDWAEMTLRTSSWVIGIPLALVVIIILMLLLTQ
jgi:hypothetical protein